VARVGSSGGSLVATPDCKLQSWVQIQQSPQPTVDCQSLDGLPSGMALCCMLSSEGRQRSICKKHQKQLRKKKILHPMSMISTFSSSAILSMYSYTVAAICIVPVTAVHTILITVIRAIPILAIRTVLIIAIHTILILPARRTVPIVAIRNVPKNCNLHYSHTCDTHCSKNVIHTILITAKHIVPITTIRTIPKTVKPKLYI
jgi:hypothetical protein